MSHLSRFAACVLAGLAGLPLSVFAEGEAYLAASDASGTSALTSASAWDNPGDSFPSAEIDYYNVGYTLKTIAGQSISFAGRSLVLGDSSKYGTLGMLTGSGSCEVGFTGAGGCSPEKVPGKNFSLVPTDFLWNACGSLRVE